MNNYWLEVVKFVIMVVAALVIAFMVLDKVMTTKVFPSGRIVSSCE